MLDRIKKLIKNKIFIIGAVLVLSLGGYYLYSSSQSKSTTTNYVLGVTEKGTIINSISGTGQVSSYNEAEVKSSVSGELLTLKIKAGQEVTKGEVIAVIDSSSAQKSVRDAEISLESAKLSLEKTKKGLTDEELALAETGIENKKKAVATAEKDLETAQKKVTIDTNQVYDNAIADLNEAVTKIANSLYAITDIQYAHYNDNTQEGIKISAAKSSIIKILLGIDNGGRLDINSISKATGGLKKEISDVQTSKNKDDVDRLLVSTKDLLKMTREALNIIPLDGDMTSSEKSSVASEQSSMDSKITSLNSKQQAITSQKNTNETNINTANDKIEDAKTALEEAEKQLAFDKTVDTYDLESQELNVEQKENALYDAKQNLSDYYIKAPFSGVVAEIGVNAGDNISSSSSIATLITKEQIAEISLNEIDIAKLEVGQKATLTFDAVEDLTIAGEVIEVGAIGTTNQGVVSYAVKIIFNNQDDRIKSGMSTSANIITSAKQDVIMVSSSAIKTANGTSYVLSPNNENIDSATISNNAVSLKNKPIQKTVEIGESNDSYTEIVSGLEEGDIIVLKSVTATTTTKSTSTGQSLFQIGGGNNRSGTTQPNK